MTRGSLPDPLLPALDGMQRPQRTALALALPRHIELVNNRRAAEVPRDHLDAYVTLGWMRWAAGRLLITPRGVATRDIVNASEEERHEER